MSGAATDPARETPNSPPPDPQTRCVHLLMVHGVGTHDRLSSLLEIYQAIRSNLLSPEAPTPLEDSIPDWRLELFDEGANPPYLKLTFEYPEASEPGDVTAVYLYEVNYSALAGVVRANHVLDLTTLFVGFDLAVCWSRQRQRPGAKVPMFPGEPFMIAQSLQRVSGVMAAATGPLLGVPALLLSRYSRSFVAAFTRFFEDVATYALDKNGEELISQHLDRISQNILGSEQFKPTGTTTSELVIAGHSLGSVVTHSYVVRHWCDELLPARVVTFGSPIGMITWLWMFLDFAGFNFQAHRKRDTFFCWNPIVSTTPARQPFMWINVVNAMDPIASAFPDGVADLSRREPAIQADLIGKRIEHRYLGPAKLAATGRAHTAYIHDGEGFLEILRRATGLGLGEPVDIKGDDRDGHWHATWLVLGHAKVAAWWVAMTFISAYCALIAWHFGSDWRIVTLAALFAFPRVTVGIMAFVQRLVFGVRTKRISRQRILELTWDRVSTPYLMRQHLRDFLARAIGRTLPKPDEDERDKVPDPHPWIRRLRKLIAFVPTLGLMSIPVVAGLLQHGWRGWPTASAALAAFAFFTVYLMACATYELLAAWRAVLVDLELVSGSRDQRRTPPVPSPSTGQP